MSLKVSKINAQGEWSSTQPKSNQPFFKHHESDFISPQSVCFPVITPMVVIRRAATLCVVML